VRVVDDPARACAHSIARRLRGAVRRRGSASLAVSGGSTAPPMLAVLIELGIPWRQVGIWQVDERVAPDGHQDRNANQLTLLPGRVHLMPVTADDLNAGARRYARSLPERFDVVHLGMGDDGHTASWPPGDPVVDAPGPVGLSAPYQGRVRMTLTPGVVNRAGGRVVLTSGGAKAAALAQWLGNDDVLQPEPGTPSPERRMTTGGRRNALPIARLRRSGTVVFADPAAAGSR